MRHDEFIGRVQHAAQLPSRGAAEGLTRATLETLGERLPDPTAHNVASQLPREIGDYLRQGASWHGSLPVERLDPDEFLHRVAERSHSGPREAEQGARGVMSVLGEAVSPGLVHEISATLPGDLRTLLLSPDGHGAGAAAVPPAWAPQAAATEAISPGTIVVSTPLRIRGSAVWSGFAMAFSLWLMLELMLFGLRLTDPPSAALTGFALGPWWWSIAAAAVSLFVGGLVAGDSAARRDTGTAVLHGAAVWATTAIAVTILTTAGLGVGFGAIGEVLIALRTAASGAITLSDAAIADARSAAGMAVIGLAIGLATAIAGALIGGTLWPAIRRPATRGGAPGGGPAPGR